MRTVVGGGRDTHDGHENSPILVFFSNLLGSAEQSEDGDHGGRLEAGDGAEYRRGSIAGRRADNILSRFLGGWSGGNPKETYL